MHRLVLLILILAIPLSAEEGGPEADPAAIRLEWDLTPGIAEGSRSMALATEGEGIRLRLGQRRQSGILHVEYQPHWVDPALAPQLARALDGMLRLLPPAGGATPAAPAGTASPSAEAEAPESGFQITMSLGDYTLAYAPAVAAAEAQAPESAALVLSRKASGMLSTTLDEFRIPVDEVPQVRRRLLQVPALAGVLAAARDRARAVPAAR